jgi:hypothetical protein
MHSWANIVRAFFIILLIIIPMTLFAQQGDDPFDSDWEDYFMDLYMRGDQTFIISLGVTFPTAFFNSDGLMRGMVNQFTPPVGGTGSLMYNYYLHSRFFLGGEVSGMFISTVAGHSLFIVPLGLRIGTQFIANRFEFPISLSVGMTWHTYLNDGYYGLYVKAGGSAYFRATSEWSFGLTTNWAWYPQWTDDPVKNVDGNFIYLKLSARYHF